METESSEAKAAQRSDLLANMSGRPDPLEVSKELSEPEEEEPDEVVGLFDLLNFAFVRERTVLEL
jgi:hypothetical protein